MQTRPRLELGAEHARPQFPEVPVLFTEDRERPKGRDPARPTRKSYLGSETASSGTGAPRGQWPFKHRPIRRPEFAQAVVPPESRRSPAISSEIPISSRGFEAGERAPGSGGGGGATGSGEETETLALLREGKGTNKGERS